jgi:hypothetical protein
MEYILLGKDLIRGDFRFIGVYGHFSSYLAAATQFVNEDLPYYDDDSSYYLLALDHLPFMPIDY